MCHISPQDPRKTSVRTHEQATWTLSLASPQETMDINTTSQRIVSIAILTRRIDFLATGW